MAFNFKRDLYPRTYSQAPIDDLLTFADRESYLGFVAEWKAELTRQVNDQRDEKKQLTRNHATLPSGPELQARVASRARSITILLALRRAAKERGGEQRAARLRSPAAA
jgi:hypothetical protein